MYNPKKVRIGDVLQHKVISDDDILGKIIIAFEDTDPTDKIIDEYAHSAIYIGNGYKAEAHQGTVFKPVKITKEEWAKIDIWRLKKPLSRSMKNDLLKATESLYGKLYDDIGLIGTLNSFIGKVFKLPWLRQCNPVLNNKDKFFCSEAINRIFAIASKLWASGIVDLAPQVSEGATNPADLSRGGLLKFIC